MGPSQLLHRTLKAARGVALTLGLALLVTYPAAGAPAGAKATIGIIEGQVGYGSGGSMFAERPDGLVTRLSVGFGGKRKGWPVRFYGLLSANFGTLTAELGGTLHAGDRTERRLMSFTGGGRVLVPLVGNLRIFGDASLGYLTVSSRADLAGGLERHAVSDSSVVIELGLGLQYRFIRALSIGLRGQIGIAPGLEDDEPIGGLLGLGGSTGSLAPSFLLTTTAHF